MMASAGAYCVASMLGNLMVLSPGAAAVAAVLEVALVGAMTQLLLWIKELGARFQQTFTALMGSGAIVFIMALPISFVQMQMGDQGAVLPSVMILVLIFWHLSVVGHILRHAMSAPFFVGVLLAVIYMYVSISVIQSLFVTQAN